jgi:hypothetical protein
MMEDDYIYFVEICDYEACWYTSMWVDEDKAREQFDNYDLDVKQHETTKRFGKRKINTTEFVGEYIK